MLQKMIILPQLNDCGGDTSKKWFVFFSVRNPKSGKMERFKDYKGLNKTKNPHERYTLASSIIENFASKLKQGWSPFLDDSKYIYTDNLQYQNLARIYGKQRKGNRTVRFFANAFFDDYKGHIDPDGSYHTYQSKLRIFTQWIESVNLQYNDISAIDNETIIRFFKWLIDVQKRSRKTVNDYRQILQNFFQWLISKKIISSNPVFDIPRCTQINDSSASPIHRADIEIFKESIKTDPQLWLAIQFQYYCALRPGKELRLLKIKNIDFINGSVTINRSQAKTKITRTVIIPRCFLDEIRSVYKLHLCNKEFYVFSKNGLPGNEHLGKNTLRYRFNAFRKKLNMPIEYKFYSWKHTGGVQASISGIPDKHISMQMGHTNLTTTARYLRKMTGYQSDQIKNQFPEI